VKFSAVVAGKSEAIVPSPKFQPVGKSSSKNREFCAGGTTRILSTRNLLCWKFHQTQTEENVQVRKVFQEAGFGLDDVKAYKRWCQFLEPPCI